MSVDNVAVGDPAFKKPGPRLEIAPDERALSIPMRHAEHALNQRVPFVQVRLPACGQSVDRRNAVDLRIANSPRMKGGQDVSRASQLHRDVGSSGDEGGQLPVTRQPPHHHRRVDEQAVRLPDLIDTEVDIEREPAVQFDLPGGTQQAATQEW